MVPGMIRAFVLLHNGYILRVAVEVEATSHFALNKQPVHDLWKHGFMFPPCYRHVARELAPEDKNRSEWMWNCLSYCAGYVCGSAQKTTFARVHVSTSS